MNEGISEQELEQRLGELLEEFSYLTADDREMLLQDVGWLEDAEVRTFDAAGILARSKGLVLSLSDGTEFQLTIVRSK